MCRPPDHRVNSAVLKRGPTSHESVQPCRHRQRRTNPASRPRTRAGSLRYPALFTTLGIFPTRTFVVRTHPARRTAICADALISVSHYTAALVQRDLGLSRPVNVIYNGVDTTCFAPGTRADKTVRVLFSGNLSVRKGAYLLPDIARRLSPKVDLLYTRGLRRGGSRLHGDPFIDLGPVRHQDMPELYRSVDLVLLPTVREGLSLTVLEAMASGLPVVATDIASLPEQIVDGQGGYLCPLGDAAAFAERINELADNPGLRRRMGEFNRCRVEQMFTLERMVTEYKRVFEGLMCR